MPKQDIMVRNVDTDLLGKQAKRLGTAIGILDSLNVDTDLLAGLWNMLHSMLDQVE